MLSVVDGPSSNWETGSGLPRSNSRMPLVQALPFANVSTEVVAARQRLYQADGRFSAEAIAGLCIDEYDALSLHVVVRDAEQAARGLLRLTEAGPEGHLPFQDKHSGWRDVAKGDAEVSRFLIDPAHRGGVIALQLIEAVLRTSVTRGVSRLFINPVTGGTGLAPESYVKHFGFMNTGSVAYQSLYQCSTELMVLEPAERIAEVASKLSGRVVRRSNSL